MTKDSSADRISQYCLSRTGRHGHLQRITNRLILQHQRRTGVWTWTPPISTRQFADRNVPPKRWRLHYTTHQLQ